MHHFHRDQPQLARLGGGAHRHHRVEERQRDGGAQALEDRAAVEMFLRDEVHMVLSYSGPPKGGRHYGATVVD